MRKLILIAIAMALMMNIASATLDVFYKTTTSPYKMREYVGAEIGTIFWNETIDTSITMGTSCDVSDATTYTHDSDGRLPCIEVISPAALPSIIVGGRSPSITTKQIFVATRELNSVPSPIFEVFYKSSESPYKMRQFVNASRVVVSGVDSNTANMEFSTDCDVSDALPLHPTGRIECLEVSTPEAARITVSSATGAVVTTKMVYVRMKAPCSDSDGQNAYTLGETWGIEEYTTGGTPPTATSAYQQFNDMCSAALRPGPLTGVPYIAVEAYCDGDRVKYKGINCTNTETCEGGICVPLPVSTRTGSCADVTCPAEQVCRAGVCISRESDASERRAERVKAKINSVGVKAAALATKACGKTATFTQITGKADVDKATKATKSINDLLVKAAACKKITLKAVPASAGKLGAATAFTTLTQNAKDWVKKLKK